MFGGARFGVGGFEAVDFGGEGVDAFLEFAVGEGDEEAVAEEGCERGEETEKDEEDADHRRGRRR